MNTMPTHDFRSSLRERAQAFSRTIALPDALDTRTLEAAQTLRTENIAKPVLVGNAEHIHRFATEHGFALDGIEVVHPAESQHLQAFSEQLAERRKSKGLTIDAARTLVQQPLTHAGMMLASGLADGVVAGSLASTADVLRAAITTIGTAEGIKSVSSFFLETFPDKVFAYADCAVIPEPTAEQLADIAIATAQNYQTLTGNTPRVAMLSFSTKGSGGDAPSILHVREATAMVRNRKPELLIDGELQFDAAFVPSVGERKAPGSPVAGQANVYVFPNLNAGNIAYKITERLGGAQAIGPVVQGLRKPYLDLSRGCSAADIVMNSAIAAIMSAAGT
jgi:phosphate acetyltransferase